MVDCQPIHTHTYIWLISACLKLAITHKVSECTHYIILYDYVHIKSHNIEQLEPLVSEGLPRKLILEGSCYGNKNTGILGNTANLS